ncbi:dihydrolipoamide acetyltransferase family protein [Marinicella litoralis]|uniref:Dihydrolipoamide acetyltransferase component of pyruvate dehydrogenase complex n=1 Tax=Marinicella litoralis TaxID=644220 RepID=A0A4R6XRU8_9GAMM|nr:dihydrolipoamide acetyltransferase family protein [Marinicella litoralis]TDR20647.1 2-oxoglutarate dehydrogenase E2 component (dihydrolipoamide succinyltransferase) [Marinicella litoralis]
MSSIVEIKLSADQTEGTKATVAQWLKRKGEHVTINEPIIELETDKVMMEVIAPVSGVLEDIFVREGEPAEENIILGTILETAMSNPSNEQKNDREIRAEETPKNVSNDLPRKNPAAGQPDPPSTFISPAVRRLRQQHQFDLSQITGTGKNNRITTRDVNAYLSGSMDQSAAQNATYDAAAISPTAAGSEIIPHSQMRKIIADHMQHSVQTAPHVTSIFDLDLSAIIKHRKSNKQAFAQQGAKLTFTAYFMAAAIQAIKHQPKINSQFHEHGLEVFKHVNLGFGTALGDEGLIVPVIQQCQNLNLIQIAQELTRLTDKARNNQLTQKEVQGGTFTLSNHGVSGSLVATPIIINQPQSAILGLGKMEKRVVVEEHNGQDMMVIKPMCYVSLTIDHRALDAYQTNDFLSHFKAVIENWQ